MDATALWQRYQDHLCDCGDLGITIDVSRVPFGDDFMQDMEQPIQEAYDAMDALEAGGIANPDEGRMVGHYWLRDASTAPTKDIAKDITKTLSSIKQFAKKIHTGKTTPQSAKKFTDILQVGIGGSALGPQLVADCLGTNKDKMRVHFLDNTDPDGIARTLSNLRSKLKSTLVLVVSKSGGTPETRNGMLETEAAYKKAGLKFGRHAVAAPATGPSSTTTLKKASGSNAFRCGTGSAGGPASLAPSVCCLRHSKASTSTRCSTAPPRWTSSPVPATPSKTPRRCSH